MGGTIQQGRRRTCLTMASRRVASFTTTCSRHALRSSAANSTAASVHPHFITMSKLRQHAVRDLPSGTRASPVAASLKQHINETPQAFGVAFALSDDGMCFTQTIVPVDNGQG